MKKRKLIIATRGSMLALWQANHIKDAIEGAHPGLAVELLKIKTTGDKILDVPLAAVGGKALFVKEIEEALLDRRVDLAVHSMKDVPTDLPRGLTIGAITEREDPRDALFALMDRADFDEVIATNLTGTWHCCRAVIRGMLARRAGAIVNVASVAGVRASPGQANYAASKAGVLALTRTLAAEVAARGVRVNAVVPGLFAGGMGERLDRRVLDARRAAIPSGRLGGPPELARAVLFLASDDASYVVGQALAVDGGLSL